MKKTTIIILILVFLYCGLYAESFFETSLGFAFFSAKETATYEGTTVSTNEKSTGMTADMTAMLFSEESKIGVDLGLSVLFPLSASASGVDVDVEFFSCNWCPRIGISRKTVLNKQLTMLTCAGYELMMNFKSTSAAGVTLRSTLLVHGLYVQDRFSYSMEDGININAGLSLFFPIIGSQKLTLTGYGSEKLLIRYAGIMLNPFIGIDIKTR